MKTSFQGLKKLLLVQFVLLFTASVCQGQAAIIVLLFGDKVATESFHVSMDGGASIANLPGLENGNYSTGFYFGLGTHIKLSEQWSLNPEFKILSPIGAKDVLHEIQGGQLVDQRTNIRLNYLDVPILLQYEFAKNLSVGFGPQISFLNKAIHNLNGNLTTGESVTVSKDIKSEMEKYTFYFPVELTYALTEARSGKGINLKLRYIHGFSNVFISDSEFSSTANTWQVFLSFPFVLPEEGR